MEGRRRYIYIESNIGTRGEGGGDGGVRQSKIIFAILVTLFAFSIKETADAGTYP